jgi:hypothetical protein
MTLYLEQKKKDKYQVVAPRYVSLNLCSMPYLQIYKKGTTEQLYSSPADVSKSVSSAIGIDKSDWPVNGYAGE